MANTMRGLMSPKTPVAETALVLQLQQFFDDYTCAITHCSLGKMWTKQKAMENALKLFQKNGVRLTDEDIKRMSINDDRMMPEIVEKMPYSVRENFESLSTRLNMLVHTADHMRTSLEASNDDAFEQLMLDPKTSVIKEQILKEAVIQASQEVKHLLECQDTWVKSMEKRLDRLSRSAELAERAQQQLLKIEGQLEGFHEKVAEKSKKALMGFAEMGTRNLLHSTFSNWSGLTIKYKGERLFRKKFEQELIDKETMLIKLKERSMQNVKNAMIRKARDNEESILYNVFHEWHDEVGADKREEEEKKQLEELEAQMAAFSENKAIAARKVMARAAEDNDEATACMAFAAWAKGVDILREDKMIEMESRKIQDQLDAYKEKARNKTAQVMERMGNSTDTSLLAGAMQGWARVTVDNKKARDLENTLMGAEGKFKMLNDRQKGNASKMQTRVNDQAKQILAAKVIGAWLLEAKLHHVDKYFTSKVEGKRKQLQSVQTLFKSFAKQLEEGLATVDEEPDSERTHRATRGSANRHSKQHSSQGMSRGEGSVSLPSLGSRR